MNVTVKKESMNIDKRGINLLNNIAPQVVRFDGVEEPLSVRMGSPVVDPKFFEYISTDKYEKEHIDIDGEDFALIYDMGEEKEVNYFYFATFYGQYQSRKIEIYASVKREEIFDEKNLVASIDNGNKDAFCPCSDHAAIKVEVENVTCRFVALKHCGTHAADKITRLNLFGAYNNLVNFNKTYVKGYYPTNYAARCKVELKGNCEGKAEWINDRLLIEGEQEVKIEKGEVVFSLPTDKKINKVVVIGKEIVAPKVSSGGEYCDIDFETKEIFGVRNEYILNTETLACSDTFCIKFDKAIIDEILIFTDDIAIYVEKEKVIAEDFIGFGGNVLPTHLFEIGRLGGFNEAQMALEACRINKCKPAVVRMWFQIDWFVMDGDDYYNRKYTFNSPKMQAVLKELDAFKAAGTEIEFNFGWKVGYTAQPWFCFQNIFNRRNSAPRDLDQFAIACADCLRELIVNRGYDNIKYLTFYNESNAGRPTGYDFVCPEGVDHMLYWTEMLEKVDARLREENLRDLIEIWAAEICNEFDVWAEHLNKNAGDKYERYSFHKYAQKYDEAIELSESMRALSGNHPVTTTEFGCYTPDGTLYNEFYQNNIANFIGLAKGGSTAMLYWVLSRSVLDEVDLFSGGSMALWSNSSGNHPDGASLGYYAFSLITNYIPKHCKTIVADSDSLDLHTVAFVTDTGDYTVLVESNLENDSELKFLFDDKINKKFNKFVFTSDIKPESNLIIPKKEYDIEATDTMKDTIKGGYSFVVYTTLPPVRQVVMDEVFLDVKAGESVKLGAKVIDGEGELKWSMCDTYCPTGFKGTITEDGVYTADSTFYTATITEPYYAAKAELPTGEYGITVIKIVK